MPRFSIPPHAQVRLHSPHLPAPPPPQVVSCEMIEAVGHEHLQAYFRTLGAMLRPGGKCVIQVGSGRGCLQAWPDLPVALPPRWLPTSVPPQANSGGTDAHIPLPHHHFAAPCRTVPCRSSPSRMSGTRRTASLPTSSGSTSSPVGAWLAAEVVGVRAGGFAGWTAAPRLRLDTHSRLPPHVLSRLQAATCPAWA